MTKTVVVLVVLLASSLRAAPPTTKPAPRPDPNTVAVAFEELGFQLRVPKVWKQSQKTKNSASYQLPGGAFVVLAGKAKQGIDLKAAVEDRKKRLEEQVKGLKFLKDEATKLGGHEAWLLVYDAQVSAREVDPRTGQDLGKTVTMINRALAVTAVKDGVLVQLTFVCGDKSFEALSKLGYKAVSTFEWTTPTQEKK